MSVVLSSPACTVYLNIPKTGGHAFFLKRSVELNVFRTHS
jgi:hypothetical protein